MVMFALLLGLIGYGLTLVAYVWVIVLAFGESPGWGVACLLCAPAQLIFIIQNWEDCQNPLICWVGGIVCALAGNFFL